MTADKASISDFMPDLENGGVAQVLPSPRKEKDLSTAISRRGSALAQDKSPPPPPPLVAPVLSQVLHSGILKKKGTLATSKFYVLTKDVFAYYASEKDFKKGVSGTVTQLSTITNINSEKDALNYTVKSTNKSVQLFAPTEAEASLWSERLGDAWAAGGNDDLERGTNADSEDDEAKMAIQDEDGMFSSILGEGTDEFGKSKKPPKKKREAAEHKRSKRPGKKKEPAAPAEDISFDVDFETAFEPAFNEATSPEKRNSLSSGAQRPSLSVVTSTRQSISLFSSVGASTQTNFSPCPSPSAADTPSIINDSNSNNSNNNHSTGSISSASSKSSITSAPSSSAASSPSIDVASIATTTSTVPIATTITTTTTITTRPSITTTESTTLPSVATTTTTTTMPSTETFFAQLDASDFADFDDMQGPSEVSSTTRTKSLSTSSTTTSTFHTIASTTPPSRPGSPGLPSSSTTSSASTASSTASTSCISSSTPSGSPKASSSASSSHAAPHTPPSCSSQHATVQQNSLSPSSLSGDASKDSNAFSQFNLMSAFEQSTGLRAVNWEVLMENEFEEVEEVEDDGNFRVSSRAPASQISNDSSHSTKQGLRLSNAGIGVITLQDVLDDPEGWELLRKFAVETFDTENLDFLEEVQAYQKFLEEGDPEAALKQAKSICDQFVSEHGNKTLNINSKQRTQQLGMWKGLSPDFLEGTEFAVTVKEVKILLATNQFLRFKKTALFVTWEKEAAGRIAARQQQSAVVTAKRSSNVAQGLGLTQQTPSAVPSPSTEVQNNKSEQQDGSGKRGTDSQASSPRNGEAEGDKHHRHHHRRGQIVNDPHKALPMPPAVSTVATTSTITTNVDFEGFEDLKAESNGKPAAAAPVANGASVSPEEMDAFFSSFENKRSASPPPINPQINSTSPQNVGGPQQEDLATFLQNNDLSSVYAILTANGVKDVSGLASSHVADLKRWGISSAHSVQLLKASRAKHGAPRASLIALGGASGLDSSPQGAPPPPPREGELASVMGNIDWIKELGMKPAAEKPKEGRFSTFRRSLLGKKAPPTTMAQAAANAAAAKQPPPPPLASVPSQSDLVEEDAVKPYLEELGVAEAATLEALEAHGIRSVVHLSSCNVNKLRAIGIPMGPAVKIARSFQ